MEDFDYRSILVDSGSIVQWSVDYLGNTNTCGNRNAPAFGNVRYLCHMGAARPPSRRAALHRLRALAASPALCQLDGMDIIFNGQQSSKHICGTNK